MQYFGLLLLAASNALLAIAQSPESELPPCGLTCLLMTVPASGCSLVDTQCQCSNSQLAIATAACLQANCTMQDTLDVARVQASLCNLPHTDRGNETLVIMFTLSAVAFAAYLLRMLSKVVTKSLSFEDILISSAAILAVVPVVCVTYMVPLGFGKHLWDLDDGALLKTLRLFYVAEVVYIVVLALAKASIIWMYIRIFRSSGTFRNWSFAVLSILALTTLIITPLTIFSCRPVPYFWNKDIKNGTCLDVNALAYAHSAMAIVFDVVIITMPIGILWRLNMAARRKFLIAIMFAIGGFGLIATVLRLHSLLVFGNSLDPTIDYVPVLFWTTGELAAGIVCTCLPAIRKLLEMPLRQFIETTRSSKSKQSGDLELTPVSRANLRQPTPPHNQHNFGAVVVAPGAPMAILATHHLSTPDTVSRTVSREPSFDFDAESGSTCILPIQGRSEDDLPDYRFQFHSAGDREPSDEPSLHMP